MDLGQPPRLRVVPVAATPGDPPPRHDTVLPAEPHDALEDLDTALTEPDPRAALMDVAARHPAFLEAWARLSEMALDAGDAVTAYAYARVAYHRGLDRLRREGWGGTGIVAWAEPTNRGFLRGLRALLAAAARLGELDEASRCRTFLLELDPSDDLHVGDYPEVPGTAWTAPALP